MALNFLLSILTTILGLQRFIFGDFEFILLGSQFPTPDENGDILLPTGRTYFAVGNVEVPGNFIIPNAGGIEFAGPSVCSFTQTIEGTFFTCLDLQSRFSINRVTINSNKSGTGNKWLNITSTSSLATTEVFITDSEINGFDDLGSITNVPTITFDTVFPVDYLTGLTVNSLAFSSVKYMSGGWATTSNATALTINLADNQLFTMGYQESITSGPTHKVLNLVRGLASGFVINVSHVNKGSGDLLASGSVNEQDIESQFFHNPGHTDSQSIGSWFTVDNSDVTSITGPGTLDDIDFGIVEAGKNLERWTVMDTATGELRYDGLEDFSGELEVSFGGKKSGGSVEFDFSLIKSVDNASPLDPIQGVITRVEFQTVHKNGVLFVPVTAVTNDQIKLQVEQVSGGAVDITVSHASLEIE